MKKTFKALALILSAVFAVCCFAGCSGSQDGSKTLNVATNAEFEPFESIDPATNEYVGFDIDLMNAVAEKMDVKVNYQNMEFDGVVASLPQGTCDLAISGLTINAKRKLSVDFSDAYYSGAAQILIVNADDTTFTGTDKQTLDSQLAGKNIGVCSGFTGQFYAEGDEEWGFAGIENANIKIYENISLAIADLKNNSVDAVIMDDSVAKEAAGAKGNEGVRVIDIPLTVEEYGIAVQKDNTELLDKVNAALAELKADGTYDTLLSRWNLA